MKPISFYLLTTFIFVSLVGFADAAYLTAKHYAGAIPPCSLTNGCETVLTSPYATLGNIPISLIGALYYFLLFIAGIIYIDTKNEHILKSAAYFTAIGFFTSAILVILQVFVIKALCLYCLASAATSTILFILGVILLKKLRENSVPAPLDVRPAHELMKHR